MWHSVGDKVLIQCRCPRKCTSRLIHEHNNTVAEVSTAERSGYDFKGMALGANHKHVHLLQGLSVLQVLAILRHSNRRW